LQFEEVSAAMGLELVVDKNRPNNVHKDWKRQRGMRRQYKSFICRDVSTNEDKSEHGKRKQRAETCSNDAEEK
jgi:hypothetical protein